VLPADAVGELEEPDEPLPEADERPLELPEPEEPEPPDEPDEPDEPMVLLLPPDPLEPEDPLLPPDDPMAVLPLFRHGVALLDLELPEPLEPLEPEPLEPDPEPEAPMLEPDDPDEPDEPDEPELPELPEPMLEPPELPELPEPMLEPELPPELPPLEPPELPDDWATAMPEAAASAAAAAMAASLVVMDVMLVSPYRWMEENGPSCRARRPCGSPARRSRPQGGPPCEPAGGSSVQPSTLCQEGGNRHAHRAEPAPAQGPDRPPPLPYTLPVVNVPSDDASSTYTGAISAGCPGRPSGVSAPNFGSSSGNWPPLGCSGVQ
jgi:hypothetical protein